ncbi:MAG: hypothetical protein AAB518_03900 [Patescibacteria group bacterium]
MKPENRTVKVIFGIIIFLFSIALAYFSADYFAKAPVRDTFSIYLLVFGAFYILVGLAVARIYPVSLGFLFSADVLLLHGLGDEYADFGKWVKIAIIGGILLILYASAWIGFDKEKPAAERFAAPMPPQ